MFDARARIPRTDLTRKSVWHVMRKLQLETRAAVESGGLAVLHGGWVIEPPPGLGVEIENRGVSTEVVRRQRDGTWLFVTDNPYTPLPFPA